MPESLYPEFEIRTQKSHSHNTKLKEFSPNKSTCMTKQLTNEQCFNNTSNVYK